MFEIQSFRYWYIKIKLKKIAKNWQKSLKTDISGIYRGDLCVGDIEVYYILLHYLCHIMWKSVVYYNKCHKKQTLLLRQVILLLSNIESQSVQHSVDSEDATCLRYTWCKQGVPGAINGAFVTRKFYFVIFILFQL